MVEIHGRVLTLIYVERGVEVQAISLGSPQGWSERYMSSARVRLTGARVRGREGG